MGQTRAIKRQLKFRAFKNSKIEQSKNETKSKIRTLRKSMMNVRRCKKHRLNKRSNITALKRDCTGDKQLKTRLICSEGKVGRKKKEVDVCKEYRARHVVSVANAQVNTTNNSGTNSSAVDGQTHSNCASTITLSSMDEVVSPEETHDHQLQQQVNNNSTAAAKDEEIVVLGRFLTTPSSSRITSFRKKSKETDSQRHTVIPQVRKGSQTLVSFPRKWYTAILPQRGRPQSPFLVQLSTQISCAFRKPKTVTTIKLPPQEKESNPLNVSEDILDSTLQDLKLDPLIDGIESSISSPSSFGSENCTSPYWTDLATLADFYGVFPLDKNSFDNLPLLE